MSKKQKSIVSPSSATPLPQKKSVFNHPLVACMGAALAAVLFLFWPALTSSRVTLWFSDGNLPQWREIVEGIRLFGGGFWRQYPYLGDFNKDGSLLYPNWPLLAILPLATSMWINIAVHILWATLGAWFCARRLGIGRYGSAFAGIAFGLTTHFVSLLGAGHLGKLQCIPWIPWTFGLFLAGWQSHRFRHFLLAAMCYACMWMSGEPQLAYYLGLYLVLVCLWQSGLSLRLGLAPAVRPLVKRLMLSAACAVATVILGWQGISHFAGFAVGNTTSDAPKPAHVASPPSPAADEEAYAYATGWSFPPEETAVFLTTGRLFGLKSPLYWGRTGTPDYSLKQVDDYMGVLVFAFALLGALQFRRHGSAAFLLIVMGSSLLAAFGRFTPVYRLIYSLPTMASQSVPARWIALTAFAFSMLAGIGMDRFVEVMQAGQKREARRLAVLPIGMAVLAFLFLFYGLGLRSNIDEFAASRFGLHGTLAASPNPAIAGERANLYVSAIVSTALWLLAAAAVLGAGLWLTAKTNPRTPPIRVVRWWAAACLALTAVDLARTDRHYIEFFDWEQFYQSNSLVELFKSEPGFARIQPIATQQHPFLNQLIAYVGPWNRLRTAEPPYVRKADADMEVLFKMWSQSSNYRFNPRYYDFFCIKYVLSAARLPDNVRQEARLELFHELPFDQIPPLYLYRYRDFSPNPCWATNTIAVKTDSEVLSLLGDADFDANRTVVGIDLPLVDTPSTGTVALVSVDRTTARLRVSGTGAGWLLLKMKYDPDLKAFQDDRPIKVYRVNYLQCGLLVAGGDSSVRLVYSPSRKPFTITFAGWVVSGLVLAGIAIVARCRRRVLTEPQPCSARTAD